MRISVVYWVFVLFSSVGWVSIAVADEIDILIQNGFVVDPANNRNGIMDIAVTDGRISRIQPSIPAENAGTVIDATGLFVVPGLIDVHSHLFVGTRDSRYLANSYDAVAPDSFSFRSCASTMVDAGSSGWRNFETFKRQTIDHSQTRVLAYLNIVGGGMRGYEHEQKLEDMSVQKTAEMIRRYPDLLVGVKLAHYDSPSWVPTNRAIAAAEQAGVPVMIDFGSAQPELSLEKLLLEKLRPGDIFTHAFANVNGREPIVDQQGRVKPFIFEALDNGIRLDVGHGGGSFLYSQAVPALQHGVYPTTLGTDLHIGAMNAGLKNLPNLMSKFLNLGMPLDEVIEAVTSRAAESIGRADLGSLTENNIADIALLKIDNGSFGFYDVKPEKMQGERRIDCQLLVQEGRVVWDANGHSIPFYVPAVN
ncbi:Deacetylase [BD1-7 clade bacterium]|uniref:Deacetylase n=1 Tax=BD1-7 clade bacterium TaxID=2029982 RepID=A0A5S9PQU2_9GAMM|nr:Deacetylase [BD1-7 clade bacterium]